MKKSALFAMAALVLIAGCNPTAQNSPVATYSKGKCSPGQANWMPKGSQSGELMWSNAINIEPGQLEWNGNPVTNGQLKHLLAEAAHNPFGGMVLVVGPSVPCDQVDEFRRTITASMKCGKGRICVEYSTDEWQATQPPPLPSKESTTAPRP
ncbi:hypothetical protein WBP06_12585 [Novosphingobium sp. BL-8H]|uniref:hypothetical protein n=1 Tax=Novosphingobium sp. BL-8H TaxID=3127640 RepID=UPI003756E5F5